MLSKLIKYDIRSTWRDFAGVYASILLGVLILPPLFNHFQNNFVSMIAGFVATGIVIATIVITIITLFRIFNTNVFSREGYLTMTLPVTSGQIVASKLLVSTMWIVLTGIVSLIGVCIFVINLNAAPLAEIADAVRKVLAMLDGRGVWAAILIVAAMIASTVKEISKLFLACSIAHLKQLNRFRVPAGILSFFLFSWIETLIVQAVGLVVSMIPGLDEYARQLNQLNGMNDPSAVSQFIGLFSGVMAIGILYAVVLTAVYSIANVWILNHRLDLD